MQWPAITFFLGRNQIAYADDSDDGGWRQIGSCIFTKSEMSCDVVAIEILNECDVIYKRDDGKDVNEHTNCACHVTVVRFWCGSCLRNV